MGTQADSSDESDDEEAHATSVRGTRSYTRVAPAWRSRRLGEFLWDLDAIAQQQRQPKSGCRRIPGAAPRHRRHSQKINDNTIAPAGLPRNCYREEWLAGLWPFQLEALSMKTHDYDFSISTVRPSSGAGPSARASTRPVSTSFHACVFPSPLNSTLPENTAAANASSTTFLPTAQRSAPQKPIVAEGERFDESYEEVPDVDMDAGPGLA